MNDEKNLIICFTKKKSTEKDRKTQLETKQSPSGGQLI